MLLTGLGNWTLLSLLIQATQLTHAMEGRLKDAQKEADKEKALK